LFLTASEWVHASTVRKGDQPIQKYLEADAIRRYNVIALVSYPRVKFDAAGLMRVVKNHNCALIRNNDKWEVIESSEARIAQDALIRTEEKLRSLFSYMAEGFAYHRIVLDEKGKPCDYIFLETNDAFEKLVGIRSKNIIGKLVTQVMPGIEKDPTDWIGRYGKVALTGIPTQFESYSQNLKRWYSVSAFCPHKGFFAVTFSDVTDKKTHENELLRAKIEWERTFDSVPDLIVLLDRQHRVIRANKSMADRLGVTPDQCVGAHCYEVIHGCSCPPDFCPHARTIQDGKEHLTEVYEPHLSGDFLVSTTPIYNDEGQLVGSTHVARDITELKKAEEALKKRTQELENFNRELESFSYTVSHDLRAPLRSMDGFSQALLEDYAGKLDKQGKEWLTKIRASSQNMAQLIDDILGLSRMVRAELRIQRVNLSDLAESVAGEIRATHPERPVDFKIMPGLESYGDINLLRIALTYLLDNAFKFTARCRNAKIEFGIKLIDGNRFYFVKDNGAGFEMSYADKLFKAFQRLHNSEEFPGTGIGLATVQRIIHRHGGKIMAEGQVGKGATFYFSLSEEINNYG
jgi:PAS domain S-box-containing protein